MAEQPNPPSVSGAGPHAERGPAASRTPAASSAKLWGGRFTKQTDQTADRFLASLPFDRRLYRHDIAGSIAHAKMLGACGIISPDEAEAICTELMRIREQLDAGDIGFPDGAEDIHMAIEKILIERLGDVGRKLHTARSRNDQVITDVRLYVKDATLAIDAALASVQDALVTLAESHTETILPGYTHMQRAQPVLLAHHLLAYFEMFMRDRERFADCRKRTDLCPLGSGALAGVPYPIDRMAVAADLGFAGITANSLDAVSDRDFILEFMAAAAILATHLSRLGNELVLWSTSEFQFVEMDDAFATGSSIMPQKKNPDVAELVRGKSGRVVGHLVGLLTVMKGLPLAYNTDMQEDKEGLFDTVDTLLGCLSVVAPMLRTIQFRTERMAKSAIDGYLNATDVADYLAKRGVPFRTAHEIVGRIVLHCVGQGRRLEDLSLDELRTFWPGFQYDVFEAIQLQAVVDARDVPGGTAGSRVKAAVQEARTRLAQAR